MAECKYCPARFVTAWELEEHERGHMQKVEVRTVFKTEVNRRHESFAKIKAETGGYAPLVTLTLDVGNGAGELSMWMDADEAKRLGAGLAQAGVSLNTDNDAPPPPEDEATRLRNAITAFFAAPMPKGNHTVSSGACVVSLIALHNLREAIEKS